MKHISVKRSGEIMQEIWRDIKGYEGMYQVSNLGRVKSLERQVQMKRYIKTLPEKIMKLTLNKRGYLYIALCKNGRYQRYRVHRLVATTFIPNPHNKPQVNHIDRNVLNNSVDNLEWCTNEENMKHASATGFRKGKKNVN